MTRATSASAPSASTPTPWRRVAIPAEHGGWGLTLEPVLLGVLLTPSWAGAAVSVVAFLAFLVRTPLKLVLVDRRRRRSLPRTALAAKFAAVELVAIGAVASFAVIAAGWRWLVPVVVALPLVVIELWFDVRSRSRRLVPELCGAVGIASVAAAIVLAGDGDPALATAAWMVLAARAVASIPYVRTQIVRMRHRHGSVGTADAFSGVALLIALVAVAADRQVLLGTIAVAVLVVVQSVALRRDRIAPAKVIGLRQMVAGVAVVTATWIGAVL